MLQTATGFATSDERRRTHNELEKQYNQHLTKRLEATLQIRSSPPKKTMG